MSEGSRYTRTRNEQNQAGQHFHMRILHSSVGIEETRDGFAAIVHEVERGGRISLLTGLTGHVIGFCLQIILTRTLGAKGYGLYTLGHSVLEVAGHATLLGLENGAVNFLAIFRGENDEARVRGTILYSTIIVLAASSFVAICLWLSAGPLSGLLFQDPSLISVLRGFAVSLPFYALLTLFAFCARGFRHMKYYSGVTNVIHPLGNLLLVVAAFWLGMNLNGAIWAFVLSTVLSFLLMIHLVTRIFPQILAVERGCLFEKAKILPYSIKVYAKDLSQLLLRHTDRVMLGYLGTARDVGIYNVANLLGGKIGLFQHVFNGIFAPVSADLYNKQRKGELGRIFQTVTAWTMLLTLPFFFVIVFFGDHILNLFGTEFREAWPILVVLAVSKLINVGTGPVGYMLVMTGRPTLELINSWVAGLINILLNFWLIPEYGALGAALATGSSIVIVNLVRLLETYIIHHCHPFRYATVKALLAFTAISAVLWKLNYLSQSSGWETPSFATGLFMFGYFGLLATLGWDKEDKLVLDRLRHRIHRSWATLRRSGH
jgi:O-antigen/teichoic acid export membrane protein